MPTRSYPRVHDEFVTVRKVLEGFSIARAGDGELKMMYGYAYVRELPNEQLAAELRQVVRSPNKNCIVGIPTMDPAGPKYPNWRRHEQRFIAMLGDIEYYSAFITRPDSAPAINNREYAELMEKIWSGKSVALISSSPGKFLNVIEKTARVQHIPCLFKGASTQIDQLEGQALKAGADVILLSCGPTATCLANRLSEKVQAIDIGSAGGFLARMLL